MSQFDYTQNKNQRSDLLAVVLSFAGQFIQLLLILVGAAAQTPFAERYFVYPQTMILITVINLVISLVFVGIVSYWRKNKTYFYEDTNIKIIVWLKKKFLVDPAKRKNTFNSESSKRWMLVGASTLIIASLFFVLSTLSHITQRSLWVINSENVGLVQVAAYMALWILTTVLLFIWISFELEKRNQFKQEDFLPNFIRSLQNQGYIQIKTKGDVSLNNSNHLLYCELQGDDKYFVVSYDGKSIIKEVTKTESDILVPPVQLPTSQADDQSIIATEEESSRPE